MHIGNKQEKNDVINRVKSRKHCLIYGIQGVGKTSFVRMFNRYYNVIEIDASKMDAELPYTYSELISKSFNNKNRIIFLDEVDHVKSEIVINFIVKLLEQNMVPVILACNFLSQVKKSIKENENIKNIKFKIPSKNELKKLLSLHSNDETLIKIALKTFKGDVRQALLILKGSEGYTEDEDFSNINIAKFVIASKNRDRVFEILERVSKKKKKQGSNKSRSLFSIFAYTSFNILKNNDDLVDLINNAEALSIADKMLYKCSDNKYITSIMAYGINGNKKFSKMKYPYIKVDRVGEKKKSREKKY